LTTVEALCDEIEGTVLVCGEIKSQDAEVLSKRLGARATIASPAASLRRPAYLAELGWERLGRGDIDDPRSLAPIYLQNPQIDA
jgi:tRNA threonylcarbamoyladenosine biosynthesis protein TsaB